MRRFCACGYAVVLPARFVGTFCERFWIFPLCFHPLRFVFNRDSQPLSHQSLAHSFAFNRGEGLFFLESPQVLEKPLPLCSGSG
jgi:hypothetical protein